MRKFWRSGDPFIWLTGTALALCLLMIAGMITIILFNGAGVFWARDLVRLRLDGGDAALGQLLERQAIPQEDGVFRVQFKVGNRDAYGLDFRWVDEADIQERDLPGDAVVFERMEWGDFYGFISGLYEGEQQLSSGGEAGWEALQPALERSRAQREGIEELEEGEIGRLNYRLEDLRLEIRRREMESHESEELARLKAEQERLWTAYEVQTKALDELRRESRKQEVAVTLADGRERRVRVVDIVRAYRPNRMSALEKAGLYLAKTWEFVSGQPRESNTEGGIFPNGRENLYDFAGTEAAEERNSWSAGLTSSSTISSRNS